MTNWSFKIISAINLNQTIQRSEKALNYNVFTGEPFEAEGYSGKRKQKSIQDRMTEAEKVCAKVLVDKKTTRKSN